MMRERGAESDSPVFDFLRVPPPDPTAIALVPGNSTHIGDEPGDPRRPGTFAHVQVINSGVWAPRVRCGITFLRLDGSPVFTGEMPGRWSGAPEPLIPVVIPGTEGTEGVQLVNVPDISKLPAGYVKDLAPKEADSIAVALRCDDGTCWGWTPESYLHQSRHPSWRLPMEPLRVVLRVLANGVEYEGRFLLDPTVIPRQAFGVQTADTRQVASELALARNLATESPTMVQSGGEIRRGEAPPGWSGSR